MLQKVYNFNFCDFMDPKTLIKDTRLRTYSNFYLIEDVFVGNESVTNEINSSLYWLLERRIGLGSGLFLLNVLLHGKRVGNGEGRSDFSNERVSRPTDSLSRQINQIEDRVWGQLKDGQWESRHFQTRHESSGENPLDVYGVSRGQFLLSLINQNSHL